MRSFDSRLKPFGRVEAVIFDMDGTILDSEPAYFKSDRAFLASWGIEYDEEFNRSMVGRGAVDFFKELEARHPTSAFNALPLDERLRLKDEYYLREAAGGIPVYGGVRDFIVELKRRGLPAALASGSTPAVILASLTAAGLYELFGAVVSATEVPRGKPAPDIFIEAARRLGVEPSSCLVLEDSRPGVAAAKAAGMSCIALPHPNEAGDPAFGAAELVVEGGAAAFRPEAAWASWDFGA